MRRLVPTFQPGAHLQNGDAEVAASEPLEPPFDLTEELPAESAVLENVVRLEDAIAARGAAIDASNQAEVGTS